MLQSHFGDQSVVCGIPCHTLNNAMVGDDDELFYLSAVRIMNGCHYAKVLLSPFLALLLRAGLKWCLIRCLLLKIHFLCNITPPRTE